MLQRTSTWLRDTVRAKSPLGDLIVETEHNTLFYTTSIYPMFNGHPDVDSALYQVTSKTYDRACDAHALAVGTAYALTGAY